MSIGDMQHAGEKRARIIPPDLVNQIIEEHLSATPVATEIHKQDTPEPTPAIMETAAAEPAPVEVPTLTQEEKLLQLAEAALPASDKLPAEKTLTPEEVEKLLHE